ncbi:MAG TPA: protein translocase subunit SecF [Verrucomicrobiae bacterium]|jgi:preprotein translocase SecF subunit|nr:protein translocase subunit SecF [Verrucomicrobiae bacterium]
MLFRRLNWNIVGWFRTVSNISYVLIALGFGAMIYHGFQGGQGFQPSHMLRLGLSFTGGTEIDATFTGSVSLDAVKAAVAPLNLQDQQINTFSGAKGNGYAITTQTSFANDSKPLWTALDKAGTVDRNASSITAVGPSLGSEYLRNAILALIIALSIQFLYIAFRFGWNYIFGLVTIVALVRDAAMMIGIYAMADRRADDAFLAAVLTVIGYSVMDTIVILDRIRENTKVMAGQPYEKIVNDSIKQTMTRSLNTLATVAITLVALLALGGPSLKNFAFALLVGICSGGYHSIFFSAPLVLVFRTRQLAAAAKRRAAGFVGGGTSARARAESAALGSSRSGIAREDIVAARRERRAKAKAPRQPSTGPARYKRKPGESTVATAETAEYASDVDPEYDPLDAQNAGLDEDALAKGHEEVELNFEGFDDLPATDEQPPSEHEQE